MAEQLTLYYWYTSDQSPPWNRLVMLRDGTGIYGYPIEPSKYFIERFDLRFLWMKTWEEMTEY